MDNFNQVKMKFYQETGTNLWVIDEHIGVPSGTCVLIEHDTNFISVEGMDGRVFLPRTTVTNIQKENTSTYASLAELKTAVSDLHQ